MSTRDADATATWVQDEEVHEPVGVLVVVEGPDRGLEVELPRVATVGNSEAAAIRLSDPAVSRLHAELARQGDTVLVRDLGSKNGTWLGSAAVGEVRVAPGTELRLGATTIGLHVRPGAVRRPTWRGGDRLGRLVGRSPAMHELFAYLARVAPTPTRVLLRGESGTGKELAARTLHELSPRRAGPFVVVDAAAMLDTLTEDELFGHVPGAFTGADRLHAGAFERADGGTLFLDEVGELPLSLQPKLLRVLEEGTVQRLGDTERFEVDVRVVAATHRDLARMVNERTFREDLYYRLAIIELSLPPLRDRLPDVPLLARAILEGDAAPLEAEAAVMQALDGVRGYGWPGNVRELRSFVRRAWHLGPAFAAAPAPTQGGARVRADLSYHEAKQRWVDHFEREYVTRVLDETSGNVTEAARRSGLSRVHLGNLKKRHGLG